MPHLNEALTTYRACYGKNHEAVASTQCAIASIYKGFHKYPEATNMYRKALIIREKVNEKYYVMLCMVVVIYIFFKDILLGLL